MHRSVARRKVVKVGNVQLFRAAAVASGYGEYLVQLSGYWATLWPSLTALRNMTLSFSFYSEISDLSFLSKIKSLVWVTRPAPCSRDTGDCFPADKAAAT